MKAAQTTARAPGKAILSGEHSVLYGAPALALAVNRCASAEITVSSDDEIELQLADTGHLSRCNWSDLAEHYHACENGYRQFLNGDCGIHSVLPDQGSLYLFALAELCRDFPDLERSGIHIRIHSEIPIGAGMGSSAATVAAMIYGLTGQFGLTLSREQLFRLTQGTERLQHGRSSGIDPAVCCYGGLIRFDHGDISPQPFSAGDGWYLLDSGRPEVSTGACCEQVRKGFADSEIWSEFAGVTRALDEAIAAPDSDRIQEMIRHNHRLLCTIGVVPEPIQQLISLIEQQGGAAKISGAGASQGDRGGLVLIRTAPGSPAPKLPDGYPVQPLQIDQQGVRFESVHRESKQ